MPPTQAAPGTLVVWSDVGCPWAHVAVHRLRAARERLGLDGAVHLDHRAFPLEVLNSNARPKRILDAEVPVAGGLEPAAGWSVWQRPDEWAVSVLLALEAVQAAREQGPAAHEELDHALRVALFRDSRNIGMWHEVLAVAREVPEVDAEALEAALVEGRARPLLHKQCEAARTDAIQGSPHVFAPDGTNAYNPGVQTTMSGPWGTGFPIVEKDDPAVYEDLLRRAAGRPGAPTD
jgi:predicted DsbA family dithiol-disulfide isomerase